MCNKIIAALFLSSFIFRVYGDNLQRQSSNCTCVPYYQCSEEGNNVITDGLGLLDERTYSPCTGYYDICCDLSEENTRTEKPGKTKGCGYHKSGSFPWAVSLHFQECVKCPRVYKCGASLIHAEVVVTAVHCFSITTNPGIWTAEVGNIRRSIKKIIIHHNYNPISRQNDLALAILDDPIETSDFVNVICIPPPERVLDQTLCTLSSLKTSNVFSTAPYLQLSQLQIVPPTKCVGTLQQTILGGIYFKLDKTFICAGGKANGYACIGDGGSPLVCPVSNQPERYQQVGISLWSVDCGEPGVYLNLGIFRNWIDDQMIANGFNINTYRY